MGVIVVLSLAAIPLGILVSSLRDRSLRRRSRFRSRLAGFLICMLVPWVIELPDAVRQHGSLTPVWVALGWGLLLVALAPRLLFHFAPLDPGSPDSGPDDNPGDEPRPLRPIGGIPLPDAEQPAQRVRGPHPSPRARRPRRPDRAPGRRPVAPSHSAPDHNGR